MFSIFGVRFCRAKRAKVAIAVVCAALYFGLAYLAKITYQVDPNFTVGPDVPGEKILLLKPFTRLRGFAFVSERWQLFESVADTADNLQRSPIQLFENSTRLGPAHTPYHAIVATGAGGYVHLRGKGVVVVFSTSDNTDPNTNGRAYWIVNPARPAGSAHD